MSVFKTFQVTISTINGRILEFTQQIDFRCNLAMPIGLQVVRQFDGNECIKARKVFLIEYDGQLFGTLQFKTLEDFLNYRNNNCRPIPDCRITYNGCYIMYNNCFVTIKKNKIVNGL